jgi:hypothetical protein
MLVLTLWEQWKCVVHIYQFVVKITNKTKHPYNYNGTNENDEENRLYILFNNLEKYIDE